MKKQFLLIFPLLILFTGCEFFDLEWKKVPYNIETQKVYIYSSKLEPGQIDHGDERYIQRSDFNIPVTAFIKRFYVKDVFLQLDDKVGNRCYDFQLQYSIEGPGLVGFYENDFIIDESGPENALWSITHDFTADIARIRTQIEQAIKNNDIVKLTYGFKCNENKFTDINIIVSLEFVAEYINCEEVLFGTDLEDCGS